MKDIGKNYFLKFLCKFGFHRYLRKAQSDVQSLLKQITCDFFWSHQAIFGWKRFPFLE